MAQDWAQGIDDERKLVSTGAGEGEMWWGKTGEEDVSIE